jgi:proteasome beta subunit
MNDERWQHMFRNYADSSFVELLRRETPHLMPVGTGHGAPSGVDVPHGTTVLAVRFRDGVIMAGDRQATAGYQVASRRIEKIFKSDDLSGIGIAGAAGPAMEMAKLFQTELEHYEKVEGDNLSLEGKANKLGQMIRMNLQAAMMGLAVVPVFAGFDEKAGIGRLFKYDVTGGRYEETAFHSVGSGSVFARGALKKLYRDDLDETGCVTAVVQALYDAADDDSATGGPDLTRRIFPVVSLITSDGHRRMPQDDVAAIADQVIGGRMQRPDGPSAPLT